MYTKLPNTFIDEALRTVTPAAAVCYLVICRKTAGWQKDADAISISQFMEYTGLTKPTVQRAIRELQERGIINVEQGPERARMFSVATAIVIDKSCCRPIDGQNILPNAEPVGQNILPSDADVGQIFLPLTVKSFAPQKKEDKKTKKKEPAKRDERLNQWQFTVYRELTRLHVPHAFRDVVAELTHEHVWRDVITRWIGRGYKPHNIQGMLEWYKKEEHNARRQSGQNVGGQASATSAAGIDEYLRANGRWTDEV